MSGVQSYFYKFERTGGSVVWVPRQMRQRPIPDLICEAKVTSGRWKPGAGWQCTGVQRHKPDGWPTLI